MSVVPVTGDNTAWLWSVLVLQLLSFLHGKNPALPSALNSAQGPSWLLQMHWGRAGDNLLGQKTR